MTALLLEHGPNEWNHLPCAAIGVHFGRIAEGEVEALLMEIKGELVGLATFVVGEYPSGPVPRGFDSHVAFIAEVVVKRGYRGGGIGTTLLEQVNSLAVGRGVRTVYIDRHADNTASARMMDKAGFRLLVRYPDPLRRPTGSRDTVVYVRYHS